MVTTKKITTTTKVKVKEVISQDEVNIYALSGKAIGTEKLDKEIFQHKDNPELISQYVRMYLHNQHQGTASTKTRAEVIGSSKKIYRQKGTGRARHSAAKANLFRGGGVTFGPKPRVFSLSINKKQKKQALFITLSQKAKTKNIRILDASDIGTSPKTKTIESFFKEVELTGKKTLFVLSKLEKNPFILSVQNIKSLDMIQASILNPYEVLNHKEVIFVDDALKTFVSHFAPQHEN